MWAKIKQLPVGWRYIIYSVPAFLVSVVLLAVLLNLLITHEYDRVEIRNMEVLSGVSSESVNDFRAGLIDLLQTEGYVDGEVVIDDVVVRDGTVEMLRQGDAGTVMTFLIDIDSLKQTYRVQITDTNQETMDVTAYIICPRATERKYSDTECRGHYGTDGNDVGLYLPYSGKLGTGEKYLVKTITMTSTGDEILQVYLYSCDEKNPPVIEAETAAREFVNSVGDNGNGYIYNVRVGYCEGDAI